MLLEHLGLKMFNSPVYFGRIPSVIEYEINTADL